VLYAHRASYGMLVATVCKHGDDQIMLRFGLCCIFRDAPVRFRQTTAKVLLKLSSTDRHKRLSSLCLENAENLLTALETVHTLGIGAFRVLSPLLPRYTHPEVGYQLAELADGDAIMAIFRQVNRQRQRWDIRLSFHPDQFVLLSSPNPEVTHKSIAELDYQAMLAEQIGADVINIHGGGVYGDKQTALQRLRENFNHLPERVQQRLTLENDDVSYTVDDLLPVCRDLNLPLVYDVHHHRCNPDGLSVAAATQACLESWQRSGRGEPYLHLSSPKYGWEGGDPKPHAEMIDPEDFPAEWRSLDATVDIEAKAKERAVLALMEALRQTDPRH
jgi:UV DNA damage endonuclease